ncbi:MAG: hypothetical protein PHX87_04240 [Candidatus Peribacteraceae bacterium]|nr:hypothetical protein [Candidatus Peribacteraceae bacterium]MDD5742609.1 hypothetical protein [Candidatus Peribacteraceae bacterium]
MSQDMVRRDVEEFGKDHGLIHEVVVTGRKVGAEQAFYAALAHDEALFRRVVEMVEQDPLQAALQALLAAAAQGVTCENGVYRFFDPGTPLIILRSVPVVREKKLVYPQDWYDGYDWAKRTDAPQERFLRIPVTDSFNLSFTDQEKLLTEDEEVPSTRSVATFLVVNALATGKRLLPDRYVRTADKVSDGRRVVVGDFGAVGFSVDDYWGDRCDPRIGLAASRKSRTSKS